MKLSRRDFTKLAALGGITLSLSRATQAQVPTFQARETLPGQQGWNPSASKTGRIDGPAKVTGAKLYASDFRAGDLPGWPSTTAHALLIRAAEAAHVFTGIDLSRLPEAIRPSLVVMASDLKEAGIRVPPFYEDDLLCAVGQTPLYLGQPLAMLIFERFDVFDQARLALRDMPHVTYGAETGPLHRPPYGSYRFVRVAGDRPDGPDVYSALQEGWIVPRRFRENDAPVWMAAGQQGEAGARATFHAERIREELSAARSDWLVLDRSFETQSIDPMFLEPEAGLGWYNAGSKGLELVIGVQSPQEALESLAYSLGEVRAELKPEHINSHFAYVGGGFGGRDHTPFPLYVALAAMFFPGRPVRLAHDRYQQFQAGIKRHPYKMHTRIGVERTTGKIQACAADHILDGGGLANYSGAVASVGAAAAIGIYDIPRVDVTAVALHSRGVTAGSMRGYGTLQTMTALEVLIDEVAATLPLDPIEFRRRNALKTNGRTMMGNPYSVSVRTPEILDKLEKHAIWQRRREEKARGQRAGIFVGTGVACATKDYGTGADCSLGRVEIDPE